MVAPIFRRITRAAPAALGVFAFATDDESALTFYDNDTLNTILDIVNDPDPVAPVRYTIALFKGPAIDTGRRFFTTSLSPDSSGRVAIGPVDVLPGKIMWKISQEAGGFAAYSALIKLDHV